MRAPGELDLATAPALQAACDELRGDGLRHLTVDLRGVTFMDSSGLRCILDIKATAERHGFTLELIRGPRAVQRVFELSGTAALLQFVDA